MLNSLYLRHIICPWLIFAFFFNTWNFQSVQAQSLILSAPGTRAELSPHLNPPILKGLKVHPEQPFKFDFILDVGDRQAGDMFPAKRGTCPQAGCQASKPLNAKASQGNNHVDNQELKQEANKLIKYFLASLTIPEEDLWVNLSPYEKNRIVPDAFGKTEMGRDLLAEDYMLKQITASLMYPEGETGKRFWKRIYEEAAKRFGTTNVPVNTFNKVWILPDKAVVYENLKANAVYVTDSRLKVMLEQDYLSIQKHQSQPGDMFKSELERTCPQAGCQASKPLNAKAPQGNYHPPESVNTLGSQIIREIIIPELNKEVNEGANFAQLRQVYNSLILATWYKKKIRESVLAQFYENKNKVSGITYGSVQNDTELIYQQYLQAFKKGAYNFIKEEVDPATQQITPRKYFSGGVFMVAKAMDRVIDFTDHLGNAAMSAHLYEGSFNLVNDASAGTRVINKNAAMGSQEILDQLIRVFGQKTIDEFYKVNRLNRNVSKILSQIRDHRLLDIFALGLANENVKRMMGLALIYYPDFLVSQLIFIAQHPDLVAYLNASNGNINFSSWINAQGRPTPQFAFRGKQNISRGNAVKSFLASADEIGISPQDIQEEWNLKNPDYFELFFHDVYSAIYSERQPHRMTLPITPYKVDVEPFNQALRDDLRKRMGLPADRKIVFFSSFSEASLADPNSALWKYVSLVNDEKLFIVLAPIDNLGRGKLLDALKRHRVNFGIRTNEDVQDLRQGSIHAQGKPMGSYDAVLLDTQGELADFYKAGGLVNLARDRNAGEVVISGNPVLFEEGVWKNNKRMREIAQIDGASSPISNDLADIKENLHHLDDLGRNTEKFRQRFNSEIMPSIRFLTSLSLIQLVTPKSNAAMHTGSFDDPRLNLSPADIKFFNSLQNAELLGRKVKGRTPIFRLKYDFGTSISSRDWEIWGRASRDYFDIYLDGVGYIGYITLSKINGEEYLDSKGRVRFVFNNAQIKKDYQQNGFFGSFLDRLDDGKIISDAIINLETILSMSQAIMGQERIQEIIPQDMLDEVRRDILALQTSDDITEPRRRLIKFFKFYQKAVYEKEGFMSLEEAYRQRKLGKTFEASGFKVQRIFFRNHKRHVYMNAQYVGEGVQQFRLDRDINASLSGITFEPVTVWGRMTSRLRIWIPVYSSHPAVAAELERRLSRLGKEGLFDAQTQEQRYLGTTTRIPDEDEIKQILSQPSSGAIDGAMQADVFGDPRLNLSPADIKFLGSLQEADFWGREDHGVKPLFKLRYDVKNSLNSRYSQIGENSSPLDYFDIILNGQVVGFLSISKIEAADYIDAQGQLHIIRNSVQMFEGFQRKGFLGSFSDFLPAGQIIGDDIQNDQTLLFMANEIIEQKQVDSLVGEENIKEARQNIVILQTFPENTGVRRKLINFFKLYQEARGNRDDFEALEDIYKRSILGRTAVGNGLTLEHINFYPYEGHVYMRAAYLKNNKGNPAQMATRGGIDMTAVNKTLEAKMGDGAAGIQMPIDPAMLHELQESKGFIPIVSHLEPMTNIRSWLGLHEARTSI